MLNIIDKLKAEKTLSNSEFYNLLITACFDTYLFQTADFVRRQIYGKDVYLRGLIEVTNYCKNNCFYCGIRRDSKNIFRYRLSKDEILSCCEKGYGLGFRTFVLQGGEDGYFTDKVIIDIISAIKEKFPDTALTLSLGEKSYDSYKAYFDAGADRYLLRHETANEEHYRTLHPEDLKLHRRIECIKNLKEIGFQVGSGFMVGSPFQKIEDLILDLRFLEKLQLDMIGIGPFLSHKDTPFKDFKNGNLELTLRLIAVLRLMFPKALIPATTALGTISENGRERGLLAGANVIMPNLSPIKVRKHYLLYDNKISTGIETAEGLDKLTEIVNGLGYEIIGSRGDAKTNRF